MGLWRYKQTGVVSRGDWWAESCRSIGGVGFIVEESINGLIGLSSPQKIPLPFGWGWQWWRRIAMRNTTPSMRESASGRPGVLAREATRDEQGVLSSRNPGIGKPLIPVKDSSGAV